MVDQAFTKPVSNFYKLKLSKEEYALIMAILFSQSNAEGISRRGKELLYEESVRYTKMLLRHVQNKFGEIGGVKRLDECLRLIYCSFVNARAIREMRSLRVSATKKQGEVETRNKLYDDFVEQLF
uniref:NR LBD domain-containing protein n=1 Tax=Meloidogyne hapla TaxID=6305 RepID=A0A1I8BMN6_MELHA